MPASNYVTSNDIQTYLKDVAVAPNAQVWNFFASVVSRWIDDHMGQYFYSDGPETKYFDSDNVSLSKINTGSHPFYGKIGTLAACSAGATSLTYTQKRGPIPNVGDVLTLDVANTQEQVTVSAAPVASGNDWTLTISPGTAYAHAAKTSSTTLQVTLAYFENQPLAQWTVKLSGDGVTPPSNFYAWPRNPKNAGSVSDPTQRDPWFGVDIAHIPISSTSYLPSAIPGYMTIAITANWGWPVVPDVVKDLCGRIVTKIWRARGAGWSETIGSGQVGQVHNLLHEFNALDEVSLIASRYKNLYL